MNAIQRKPTLAMRFSKTIVLLAGACLSFGGKVAPQTFSAILMRSIFSPTRTKISGRAKEILARATVETREVDGNNINHYVWGSGDQSVLLVHGWSGNAGQMTAIADALVGAGFKVIAIDFPGHGQSSGKQSSVIHFERVIANANTLYGPFHAIVAHSLGAAAASLALSRGIECQRAVFIGPVVKFGSVWSRTQQLFHISPKLLDLAVKRAANWLNISFDDIEPVRLAPSLSAELLVVHDQDDKEAPIADSQELVRAWPNAKLAATDKLGHTRILYDGDAVQKTVDFIRNGHRNAGMAEQETGLRSAAL